MALELVAGALLSASLQVLFERFSKEIPQMFQGRKLVADQLYELKTMLGSAGALLNDAEEKQLQSKEIKTWLSELQDVIYRADDLVDRIDNEALRFKLEDNQSGSSCSASKVLKKFIPPFLSKFDRTVKFNSMEILRKLKILVNQKDALGLRECAQNKPSPRAPAPLVEHDDVYGRDTDKNFIVDLLLKDDVDSGNNISVIPIVGMGGLGKTTLAQIVYDDNEVKEYFEQKVWVTVSDEFDILKITKEIYEGVTGTKCDIQNFEELRRRLKTTLTGKKFFFVLDDVWNESSLHWDALKSSFESGANGSKILVTTRNTTVASTMVARHVHHLQPLLNEDCWQLFVKYAFGSNFEENSYKDLQALGRKIVEKCKGLPLAIKSLGGLLRRDQTPERWEAILDSDTWNEELYQKKESSILPALWLSYRHLPADVKPCFAFCSIFPKDHEFDRENLIMLWMAEGFLPMDSKSKKMEEFGKEYFEELLSRSFFQRSCKDKSMFQMHDFIHDIAMLVSNNFCLRLDSDNYVHSVSTKIRHVSCKIHYLINFIGLYLSREAEANYLHTFLSLEIYDFPYSILAASILFTKGSCLRVLSLSGLCIKELPNSIGKLKHLRYLDLSGNLITELPDSICSLYNLQTLLLSRCGRLSRLPKNMERLLNLRYLDIEDVPLKEMPQGINKMKCLQFLSKVILSDKHKADGFKITELKHPLSGKLQISGLENVNDAAEASKANLKDKKNLAQLSLSWSCGADDDADDLKRDLDVLTALRPHTNLKCLKIEGYRNTTFSKWIGDSAFSNLASITLRNCKSCRYIPPLGQLASLKELEIMGCDSVCSIGHEIGSSGPLFPCLENLCICNMLMLKEWSFVGEAIVQEAQIFPLLKKLELENCPKLNAALPGCLPRTQQTVTAPPSLESVSILNCPVLESRLDWGSYSKLKILSLFYTF